MLSVWPCSHLWSEFFFLFCKSELTSRCKCQEVYFFLTKLPTNHLLNLLIVTFLQGFLMLYLEMFWLFTCLRFYEINIFKYELTKVLLFEPWKWKNGGSREMVTLLECQGHFYQYKQARFTETAVYIYVTCLVRVHFHTQQYTQGSFHTLMVEQGWLRSYSVGLKSVNTVLMDWSILFSVIWPNSPSVTKKIFKIDLFHSFMLSVVMLGLHFSKSYSTEVKILSVNPHLFVSALLLSKAFVELIFFGFLSVIFYPP